MKAVYDKLFEAFANDRRDLVVARVVPSTQTRKTVAAGGFDIEESLSGIYGKSGGATAVGKLFDNISPAMLKNVSSVQEVGKNSFVLCGADKDQVCTLYPDMLHSLLTYYFLEGLQGRADTNRGNKISGAEMAK